MVLARLDRSAHNKIIMFTKVLIELILFKEYRGNRERHGFYRDRDPSSQPKRLQNGGACGRCRYDEPGSIRCRTIDNPPVPTITLAGHQFRMFQRDHVVKHE